MRKPLALISEDEPMIVIEYRDVTQRGWLCGGLRAKLQSCTTNFGPC